jgi:Zn-dependent peptidase ImmA (M78 family)/DNA-binding XRE family transcriptional regulator
MSRTPQIPVSGPVMKWARDNRGLTIDVAAKRSGVSRARLEEIEAGRDNPSLAQLRKLAEVYRRPLIVLLLEDPPTTFQPLADYRLLPDSERSAYSPELRDEMRRSAVEQETYADLAASLDRPVEVPALPEDTGDPESLAAKLRDLLVVTAAKQSTLHRKEDAFAFWRSAVEDLGVLVLEASRVDIEEMRGFSLSDRMPPVIVLNGQDEPRGKIFTLLHELCHLCLRKAGVCDLRTSTDGSTSDIEIYCNTVAGATLLPRSLLEHLDVVREHSAGQEWSDTELSSISDDAGGASRESVLRRLVQLDLASKAEYDRKRSEFVAAYADYRKRSKGGDGGPPPHRIQLRDRGRPFVRSVFDAYGEGLLTLSDLDQ